MPLVPPVTTAVLPSRVNAIRSSSAAQRSIGLTMRRARIISLLFVSASFAAAADARWTNLFDGKSLKGWTVCNGSASYRAQKGEITGTTVAGSPNSFLCTDREYGDFVL